LHKLKGVAYSPAPDFDLDQEYKIQSFVTDIIKEKLVQSAHDISEGGLAITLLESGFTSDLGFVVNTTEPARKDAYWFGEAQSRIVVSVAKEQLAALLQKANAAGITATELGTVTSGAIHVNGNDWGNITSWKNKYDTAIEKLLN
jgi:phosphoribosylformylglycinamidine synthase